MVDEHRAELVDAGARVYRPRRLPEPEHVEFEEWWSDGERHVRRGVVTHLADSPDGKVVFIRWHGSRYSVQVEAWLPEGMVLRRL